VAFERGIAWLRRPAVYRLLVEASAEPPPGPGRLRVLQPAAPGAGGSRVPPVGGGAVELILDASGSMLQTLQGRRRIDVARQVLIDLVTRTVPAGSPLALRVLGHRRAGGCDTELLVPLQPLNPAVLTQVLGSVRAKNLAKTPLAEALRLAAADLASVQGPKLLVLVTDGDETCGGNPAAELETLAAQGLDLRVNIVGFALEDATLAQTFTRWAHLGGGRYFGAEDAEQLGRALELALRPAFEVLAPDGTRVATGQVDGEPVELPPGFYDVQVATQPPQSFSRIEVPADGIVDLRIRATP
jgi:hypothetical protein